MKPQNIKEARELADRYDSITLKEIKGAWSKHPWYTYVDALGLIGFGRMDKCTLCTCLPQVKLANNKMMTIPICKFCIYYSLCVRANWFSYYCMSGPNKRTYIRIQDADTPLKLRNAFRARAKHIRGVIKQWD